jgi:hypothetical protein
MLSPAAAVAAFLVNHEGAPTEPVSGGRAPPVVEYDCGLARRRREAVEFLEGGAPTKVVQAKLEDEESEDEDAVEDVAHLELPPLVETGAAGAFSVEPEAMETVFAGLVECDSGSIVLVTFASGERPPNRCRDRSRCDSPLLKSSFNK